MKETKWGKYIKSLKAKPDDKSRVEAPIYESPAEKDAERIVTMEQFPLIGDGGGHGTTICVYRRTEEGTHELVNQIDDPQAQSYVEGSRFFEIPYPPSGKEISQTSAAIHDQLAELLGASREHVKMKTRIFPQGRRRIDAYWIMPEAVISSVKFVADETKTRLDDESAA